VTDFRLIQEAIGKKRPPDRRGRQVDVGQERPCRSGDHTLNRRRRFNNGTADQVDEAELAR